MEPIETQVTPQVNPPVTLSVREYGGRDSATHVLLLHGYPNDQRMWEPVVEALPDEWHVVTVDNRGAGRSTKPAERSAYVLANLVEDVVAVLEETVPAGARVHLVGHDWGSVLGWDVVAASGWDSRLQDRLASYTSVSGPPLDHLASRTAGLRGKLRGRRQLLHSWYVGYFLLPRVPELSWRYGQSLTRRLARSLDPTMPALPWGPDLTANALPGLGLYRANTLSRLGRPVPWRTSVPVQLVVPRRDGFIVPSTLDGLEARCRQLTRIDLDAGHWFVSTDPRRFADLVERFVRDHS